MTSVRVKIKRPLGIIQFPENFSFLEYITPTGFNYRIRYLVDPTKIGSNKSFLVRISVSQTPFIRKEAQILDQTDPKKILNNILLKSSIQKDLLRSAARDMLLTFNSDITSRIPNDITKKISNARPGEPISIKSIRTIVPKTVQELNRLNANTPIFETNLAERNVNDGDITDNQKFKLSAMNLLHISNIDPGSLTGQRTNTIIPASISTTGVKPNRVFSSKNLFKTNINAKTLISGFLQPKNISTQFELNLDDYINVSEQQEQTIIAIDEKFNIPNLVIPDGEFYFILELLNDKGLVLQTLSGLVNHAHNIRLLKKPTQRPIVKILPINKNGKVVFEIKQTDPHASSVNIYRKETKLSVPSTDAAFTYVGKVELQYGQSGRVEDLVSSINPITYRFIPVSDEDNQGSIFTSLVAVFSNNTAKKIKHNNKPNFVSMISDVKERSIEIQINNFPSEIIAVELLRKDLTIKQKTFVRVKDSIFLLNATGNTSVVIDDIDIKPNRIYEYQVLLHYKNGSIDFSSSNIIVEFNPIINNVLTLDLNDAKITTEGSTYDVTFNIVSSQIKDNADLLKEYIQSQNLLTEFQSNLVLNKENIKKLFATEVTRTNLTTGEVENFGIFSEQIFSDKKIGQQKNVKPVLPGFEYKYTVTVYLRSPETLFPALEKTTITRTRSSVFKPYKWLHPVTLKVGNIVNNNSLKRNHTKNQFSFGDVVETKSITVSLADLLPSLIEGKATQILGRAVLVQWRVKGNVDKIDHFVIILESIGMRTIVGAAHNISNSNYFEFIDLLTNRESGALKYYIVPVYYDYTKGTELKTNQVII